MSDNETHTNEHVETHTAETIEPEPETTAPVASHTVTPTVTATRSASTPVTPVERKSIVEVLKRDPLYPEASSILHWRDPVRSGLIFGCINCLYLLVTYGEYSLLTVVSYLLLTLLGVCLAYANYVVLKASWIQGTTAENPFQKMFENQSFQISRDAAEPHVRTVLDLTNAIIERFREVFFCTNTFLSLGYAALFWFTAVLGKWFNELTLIYLVSLGFFIWPRLYEEKHVEIDAYANKAATQANTYLNLALSKIPPSVTAKFPALKPKNQ